jgi:hypothetical protein
VARAGVTVMIEPSPNPAATPPASRKNSRREGCARIQFFSVSKKATTSSIC